MKTCPDCLGEKGCHQLPYGWVVCGGCDGEGKVPNKSQEEGERALCDRLVPIFTEEAGELILQRQEEEKIWSGEHLTGVWRGDIEAAFERIYEQAQQDCGKNDKNYARLQTWINDLQSGMYINCVYCGYRYGPKDKTPCTMADVLKQHIEQCPQHPMSQIKVERDVLKGVVDALVAAYAAPTKLRDGEDCTARERLIDDVYEMALAADKTCRDLQDKIDDKMS